MKYRVLVSGLIWVLIAGCGETDPSVTAIDNDVEEETDLGLGSLQDAEEPGDAIPESGEDAALTDTESDLDADTADAGDAEESPIWACTESATADLPSGTSLFYTCLSTAEGLPYQVIRQVTADGEVVTRAEVASPERVGATLNVEGGWVYFCTQQVENEAVHARRVFRFPVAEGDVELLREFTTDDFATTGFEQSFSQGNVSMKLGVQPGGERIAFHWVDSVTGVGLGSLYVFEVGNEDTLVTLKLPDGAIRRFSWNLDGTRILYTAGGIFAETGADLSGGLILDNAVMSTPAKPIELSEDVYVYAGLKDKVRRMSVAGGDVVKEDYPETFPAPIEELYRLSEDEVLVLAKGLFVMNLSTAKVTDLGPLPGYSLNPPIAPSPSGEGFIVGGSIENPFRSFEYYYFAKDGSGKERIVGTDPSAGYVSSGVAWAP